MLHRLLVTHRQPQRLIKPPSRRDTPHRNPQMIKSKPRLRHTHPHSPLLFLRRASPHRLHQLRYALPVRRNRPHHRRNPPTTLRPQALHRQNLPLHQLRASPIALVHHKNIRDLHHPGLQTLHLIPHPRHKHQHRHIRQPHHLDLILPHPHRLDQDRLPPRRLDHSANIRRRLRHPTHRPPRSHTPDIHAIIPSETLHANPVSQ